MIRDAVGVDAIVIDLPPAATAADAIAAVVVLHPAARPYANRLAVAVNLEYVPLDHRLSGGDELALIPPVSGG